MNTETYTANLNKSIRMEAEPSGENPPEQPTAGATDPRPSRLYTVRVNLDVLEQGERSGDYVQALRIFEIPISWHGLPMTGVHAIELQFRHFLDCLQSIGITVELSRETDPARLENLRAMLAGLPRAVALEMLDEYRKLPGENQG